MHVRIPVAVGSARRSPGQHDGTIITVGLKFDKDLTRIHG